jgi:AraC family transcriptional regulator
MKTKNSNLLKEHTAIINRVIDYIDLHLDSELSLDSIAHEVSVSPFYLHRMFSKVSGENVKPYILKARIVKAAHYLVYAPTDTITEIAFRCGFSSLAVFSRAFKRTTGMSPENFREQNQLKKSKICKIERKRWERCFEQIVYNDTQSDQRGISYKLRVSVRDFPAKGTPTSNRV